MFVKTLLRGPYHLILSLFKWWWSFCCVCVLKLAHILHCNHSMCSLWWQHCCGVVFFLNLHLILCCMLIFLLRMELITVASRRTHFTLHPSRSICAYTRTLQTYLNPSTDLNPSLQVFKVHQALSPISPMFSIAAAFGNVHGVYKVNQRITFKIIISTFFLSHSVRQRGVVPPPPERAPTVCQGAAEVLRGQASLPRHARRQWVHGCRDWGSGGEAIFLFKYEIQIHKYHYSNTKYKYTNTIRWAMGLWRWTLTLTPNGLTGTA